MSDNLTVQQQNDVVPGFTSRNAFQTLWNMASIISKTTLIPEHFRGNIGNCAIAINMAHRIHADEMSTLQSLYVVNGSPAWKSTFLISVFNTCGKFSTIKYKFVGTKGHDDFGCYAYATELSTGETLIGTTVTIDIAKKEGWYDRRGSKWKTMPEQMLKYRAASWFIRTTAPELSLGLHTLEEQQDIIERDVTPQSHIEKPTAEIAQNMGTKVLDMPNYKPETKVEQEISKPPTQTQKKEAVKKEKPAQEKPMQKAVQSDLQEELSETPDF